MSTVRDSNKMSCTVMYQPYAMSSYSTCDRPPPEKKSFRFPYVPSPPDSLHSDGSSYSSPGPSSGGTTGSSSTNNNNASSTNNAPTNNNSNNNSAGGGNSRRPMTPCLPPVVGGGGGGTGGNGSSLANLLASSGGLITPSPVPSSLLLSSAPATITSSQLQQQQRSSPPSSSSHHQQHSHSHHHLLGSSSSSTSTGRNHTHIPSLLGLPSATATSSNASSTSTSHTQVHDDQDDQGDESSSESHHHHQHNQSNMLSLHPGASSSSTSSSSRAQYLSANCVVYEHYRGDSARVVEEHFTRALSASYANEKGSKNEPMTARNFPPSFWNSNYQPSSKPIMSYGPSDFYHGATVDYTGTSLTGLSHHAHHQAGDPWHPYPSLTSHHQGYHHPHRPSELSPYPPMPSSSRFNAAQYGSFLLAGAAASTSSSRFHGISPGSSQCGVKGEVVAPGGSSSAWTSGRYHPHHDSISDLHHLDYNNYSAAAAAAAYSNMTAGLETTVGQESSKGDAAYWF